MKTATRALSQRRISLMAAMARPSALLAVLGLLCAAGGNLLAQSPPATGGSDQATSAPADAVEAGPEFAPLPPQWSPRPLSITLEYPGRIWEPRQLRVALAPLGYRVAVPGRGLAVELPPLEKTGPYLYWALAAARQGRWDALGAEMANFGIDPTSLTAVAATDQEPEARMDLAFGGELDPAATPGVLNKRLGRMKELGFASPIVPVKPFEPDWRESYDRFFKSIQGRAFPILGLCIGRMDLTDLLTVPEFLRRYEGQYHSVIVNYDLTNGQVDMTRAPLTLRNAVDRASLAMALVHRASPATFVWLAVAYVRAPAWEAWVKSFDATQYSGVMLSGGSAVAACINPTGAGIVIKEMARQVTVPIGLMGFHRHSLDLGAFRGDDLALRQYEEIRAALKRVGLSPLHIRYTVGH